MATVEPHELLRVTPEPCETRAARWLARFESALTGADDAALASLFHTDECFWRDLVAFTWHIRTASGAGGIAAALLEAQPRIGATDFAIARTRTAPRLVTRLGVEVLEAFFEFRTRAGRGSGVLRARSDANGELRAWVLMTSLEAILGWEEKLGERRPTGEAYSRNFGGENWLDQRTRLARYEDREPAVLIVGGGQAGLGLAARLNQLEVDTLVVERHPRTGDNWRTRYHSLALHNDTHVNHLPYIPFPPSWPRYLPKDMLASFFEFYAEAMEINIWTGTEFVAGEHDPVAGQWRAEVRREDGSTRVLRPRHLVFANGVSGIPRVPELPGLGDFRGEVMHSHDYTDGARFEGRRALVLGTGNSGHDVAQDLHAHGVDVTLVQRGSGTVVSIESAALNYALYHEGPPLEECDLLNAATAYPLVVRGYQLATARMVERDRALIEGLRSRGFRLDIGEDGTGHQMKYQRRGGGYYLDAGCSGLIIDGEIGLLHFERIARFTDQGVRLTDGGAIPADLIVLATGFHAQQELVRRLLGNAVAEAVGPIWGWGEDGEMRNMWKRTAQPGLWFIAGSLTQCRIYSKYLALQLKGVELGLVE